MTREVIFNQEIRTKCFVIISAFEKHLGDDVKKNEIFSNEKTVNKISNRIKQFLDINSIVESSYLEEVFNLLIEQEENKDTGKFNELKELKEFCNRIELFDIRNRTFHANRPIYESDWYLIAALATHSSINILKFENVYYNMQKIKRDEIEPIDESLYLKPFLIKNNLPDELEHSETTLIGRGKKEKELREYLKKDRFPIISIVASGGIGKTALALEVVSNISRDETFKDIYDSIIFCTLKYEKFTKKGVEEIKESIKTINGIKENILNVFVQLYQEDELESFDEAIEKLSDKKILLLIDNLETIRINNEFTSFVDSLPINWKILVTSRIPVDAAKTLKLEPLNENDSIYLCKKIFSFSEKDIDDETQIGVAKKLVRKTNYNPLGILISAGRYILGGDLNEIAQSTNEELLQFSFSDLTERLHPVSIEIMEVLYASKDNNINLNRDHLTNYLDVDIDKIDLCLQELENISLIKRKLNENEEEELELKNGIYELLTYNPKNTDIRIKTANKFRYTKKSNQLYINKQSVDKTNPFYVEKSLNEMLKSAIIKLNNLESVNGKTTSNVIQYQKIMKNLDIELKNNPDEPEIYFHKGRIFDRLNKLDNWYENIKKASELNPDNVKYLNKMADALINFKKEYEQALKITERLLKIKPPNEEFKDLIIKNHIKALMGARRYKEIIEYQFESENDMIIVMHLFHKLKSYFELYFTSKNINYLTKGIAIFYDLKKNKDIKIKNSFYSRIIDSVSYFINRCCGEVSKDFETEKTAVNILIEFLDENLDHLFDFYKDRNYKGHNLIFITTVRNLCGINEINSDKLINKINNKKEKLKSQANNLERQNELNNNGYTYAKITYEPVNGRNYFYAIDENNQSYFIDLGAIKNIMCSFNELVLLEKNDKVFVKYKEQEYRDEHYVTEIQIG